MSDPPLTHSQLQRSTDFELELLKQEYFFLQTTVEDYNKQIWVIKALGITGTGAVIALTFQHDKSLIALLGSAIPLFFWILESQWKHFQRGFYPRIAELETILRDQYQLKGPAIFGGWCYAFKRQAPFKRQGYLWEGLLNPSVFVSYVLEMGFLWALSLIQLP